MLNHNRIESNVCSFELRFLWLNFSFFCRPEISFICLFLFLLVIDSKDFFRFVAIKMLYQFHTHTHKTDGIVFIL